MLIVVAFSIGLYATNVDLKRDAKFPKSGVRMPSLTRVSADYEDGVVTLKITGYTGNVQVYVSDSQGNVIGYTLAMVSSNGTVTLSIDAVMGENYFLNIVLDNATYYGQFNV